MISRSPSFHHFEARALDSKFTAFVLTKSEHDLRRRSSEANSSPWPLPGRAACGQWGWQEKEPEESRPLGAGAKLQVSKAPQRPQSLPSTRGPPATVLGDTRYAVQLLGLRPRARGPEKSQWPDHKADRSQGATWVDMPPWRPGAPRDHGVQALGRLESTKG